ncbi:tetratricopeptide repeat protein [Orbus sturtevantii]|uniref:YfgM family protein n=1 Tax=Orbus sturtevantii TaxID=3074109 RepID=UPI00370D1337
MSHSDSEEKLQEIQEILGKTWKIIVAVIIIGLLAFWGWRYWKSHNIEKATLASEQYEQLISKLNNDDPTSIDGLVKFADQNDTVYSLFADLKAAQFYVENKKDYLGAEQLLISASKKTDSEPLLAIINIRIARLEYQLGKYTDSLKSLDKVTNSNWASIVNNIRGDVLVKMENYPLACNAYEVALASQPTPELEKDIKIKLNQAQYLAAKQLQAQRILVND